MRKRDGGLVFSPSDLVVFLDSPFASFMDRSVLERPASGVARDADDDTARLLKKMGLAHEERFLETLRASGKDVVAIERAPGAVEATLAALRAGREVIYQGALRAPPFAGFADFLFRADGPSTLGPFHYRACDAKLALRPRPDFLLQLCAYADMLEAVQGVRPREVEVVTGSGERLLLRTEDFFYFYRVVRRAFLAAQAAFDPAREPAPEPRADHRHWSGRADAFFEARDHLCRVAGITRLQMRRLEEAGIPTLRALAELGPARRVGKIDPDVVARLTDQARLQRASAGRERPRHEMLPPPQGDERRGLALLPPPSPLDVHFDMEGYPFAEGGLEYLFGACHEERGGLCFREGWAHSRDEERRAFESFVDWAFARWRRDPSMHVYHYASYEVTALRRLMGRHGTREHEIDTLLRAQAFVDLYAIVRQAVRIGTPGYSLKHVERLYRPGRGESVASASDSVVQYERWLETRDDAILAAIREYNRADCESTAGLVAWLRERQRRMGVAFVAPPGADDAEARGEAAQQKPWNVLADRLLASQPADPGARELQELLANLLLFHERELKPMWWRLFARWSLTAEDLALDLDCLGGLERTESRPENRKQSTLFEYRFDPDQDTKLSPGDACYYLPDFAAKAHIETLDLDTGLVTIKVGRKGPVPPERAWLVPDEFFDPGAIRESIVRTASAFAETGALPPAIAAILRRERPRIRGRRPGEPVLRPAVDPLEAAIEAALGMEGSALCVQGPPGSGKTYTAARMIVSLIEGGRRVGIASNSHKAILNLLEETLRAAGERGRVLRAVKVGRDGDEPAIAEGRCAHVASVRDLDLDAADAPEVVGGTAWAFSAPCAEGRFDHLFVDEAGQVSLANLVGMARAARNLVLLGDQMQLAQPTQGTHPGKAGLSALEYVLAGHATIPEELGIFLGTTRRLHPAVARFISEGVYEGRLVAHAGNERRVVRLPAGGGGRRVPVEAGIVFIPVPHDGNVQSSEEEVEAIREIVAELAGRELTDREGRARRGRLGLGDILFLAPYNMQVRQLKRALGAAARVGSVDRFQGQEAPVVIVSMCASAGDACPRGIDFLFSRNRLNVAISRAQCLAIVVGSPRLARTRCTSVAQMELVNLFCRIVETGA